MMEHDIDTPFSIDAARQYRTSTHMRPVVLINHLVEPPGRITGITRYAFGLMEAIIRRADTSLVLVTTWSRDQLPLAIGTGVEAVVTLPHIPSTPLNNVRQRRVLGRIACQHNADVVYAMNPTSPPVHGIPSVITVHDLYYEIMPEFYPRRHRLWWKLFFSDAALARCPYRVRLHEYRRRCCQTASMAAGKDASRCRGRRVAARRCCPASRSRGLTLRFAAR